jgi:hypothetical protein
LCLFVSSSSPFLLLLFQAKNGGGWMVVIELENKNKKNFSGFCVSPSFTQLFKTKIVFQL